MILGVGIDVVEIDRFEKVLARHGSHFLEKVFTSEEIEEGKRLGRNTWGWAARFAAKEAVFKALSFPGAMVWLDIRVFNRENPFPGVDIGEHYLPHTAPHLPWIFHLSITHSRGVAAAVAVWEKTG